MGGGRIATVDALARLHGAGGTVAVGPSGAVVLTRVGNLVRRLYGHRDKGRALDRIVGAYAARTENRPKRARSSPPTTTQERLF